MASTASVMKELQGLLRKAEVTFRGQVEIFFDDDDDDSDRKKGGGEESRGSQNEEFLIFYFNITPSDGLYKNAKCRFKALIAKGSYPMTPPIIQCLTNIYHPNIDSTTTDLIDDNESNICVSLLAEDWQPEVGLDGCVMAVLFLFYHPQIDDALSSVCCNFESELEFEEKLHRALRGEVVDSMEYDCLIVDERNRNEDEGESVSQVLRDIGKIEITAKEQGDEEEAGKEVVKHDDESEEETSIHQIKIDNEEKNRINDKVTSSITSDSDKVCDNKSKLTKEEISLHGARPGGSCGESAVNDDSHSHSAAAKDEVTDLIPSCVLNEKKNLSTSLFDR